jgi:hypothetical protein
MKSGLEILSHICWSVGIELWRDVGAKTKWQRCEIWDMRSLSLMGNWGRVTEESSVNESMKQKRMCSGFSDSLHYLSLKKIKEPGYPGRWRWKDMYKPHRELRRVDEAWGQHFSAMSWCNSRYFLSLELEALINFMLIAVLRSNISPTVATRTRTRPNWEDLHQDANLRSASPQYLDYWRISFWRSDHPKQEVPSP